MESNGPLGSIIGFDAGALGAPGANRGRRSTDPGNETFAQVYDLAAYANSGSRKAALVEMPPPAPVATATAPFSTPLSVHRPSLEPVDRAAADRLYLHLTTGGSWLRVSDDHSGTVVMRLHDSAGAPVRELSITELANEGGPEVA